MNITTYEYNANHSLKLSKAKQSQTNGTAVEKELFLYLNSFKVNKKTYRIKNMEKANKMLREFSFGPAKKSKILISAHSSKVDDLECQIHETDERTLSIRIKRKILIDSSAIHPSKRMKIDVTQNGKKEKNPF